MQCSVFQSIPTSGADRVICQLDKPLMSLTGRNPNGFEPVETKLPNSYFIFHGKNALWPISYEAKCLQQMRRVKVPRTL